MRFIARLGAFACFAGFLAGGLAAQSPVPPSVLVSVRPSDPASRGRSETVPSDRFDWLDVTLAMLIRDAYDIFDPQIVGGPDWMRTRLWDVSAKVTALTPDEARRLVRRLVEDRFALKAHTEMRELPVYHLVLVRTDGTLGPKIKQSTVDCTPFLNGTRPMQESPRDADHRFGLCSEGGSFTPSGLLTPRLNGQPLTGLIQHLQEALEQPVIDRTGLKGNYDIELSYLDESLADRSVAGTAVSSASKGPSLFTALEQQLGMRLESTHGPVRVLAIDSVSDPTAN
jgi:uncharacterized protein (TIGR03435 family)